MGIWSGIKHALNSTLGTSSFKPLNKIVTDAETAIKNLVTSETTGVETHVTNKTSALETNLKSHVTSQSTSVKTALTDSESSLHSHIREMTFQPVRVITATGTFKPEKTGTYKVICVGAGAMSRKLSNKLTSGGGGGVAIKTLRLVSTTSYNVTVDETASFSNIMTATASSMALVESGNIIISNGGTASGGDFNFSGENGGIISLDSNAHLRGGSVGVTIVGLNRVHEFYSSLSEQVTTNGDCLLNYGGGGGISQGSSTGLTSATSGGHSAAIIVIPLEMEE